MGQNLYKVDMEHLKGLSSQEISFIIKYFWESTDDGCYHLSPDELRVALRKAKKEEHEVPQELIQRLKEELTKPENMREISFVIL